MDRPIDSITVLLVEDHFLARIALRSVLAGHAQIRVIGEAGDGEQGLTMYRALRPDVMLLDLRLPGTSGFEVLTRVRREFADARVVVLSNYQGSEDVYRAVRSGAAGYLTKDASGQELIDAITTVHRDLRYLPRTALDRLAERTSVTDLTPRETEVLTCITPGSLQPGDRGASPHLRKDGADPCERCPGKDGSTGPDAGNDLRAATWARSSGMRSDGTTSPAPDRSRSHVLLQITLSAR